MVEEVHRLCDLFVWFFPVRIAVEPDLLPFLTSPKPLDEDVLFFHRDFGDFGAPNVVDFSDG